MQVAIVQDVDAVMFASKHVLPASPVPVFFSFADHDPAYCSSVDQPAYESFGSLTESVATPVRTFSLVFAISFLLMSLFLFDKRPAP